MYICYVVININLYFNNFKKILVKEQKIMDLPGFEPGAFRMQSERDTTTLQTRNDSHSTLHFFKAFHLNSNRVSS